MADCKVCNTITDTTVVLPYVFVDARNMNIIKFRSKRTAVDIRL